MFHQSRIKMGYNISTIFIQRNLLTQGGKTFAMSYDKMNAMSTRPLDFMITEKEIRKAAEKLKNNKSPFSDKTRRHGSVYLGVVVLRELYLEHALLQLNNCHHILPEKINPLIYLFAEPHSLYNISQSRTIILSFHDNAWRHARPICLEPNCNIGHKWLQPGE